MGKSTQTEIGYLIRDGEETREIIKITDENRTRGSYVVGLPGMGKSGIYQIIVKQDIAKEYPIIVIDPHGGLVDQIIAQLPHDEAILRRVFLLDLTDEEYPFALNIFTCSDPSSSKERISTRNRVLRVFEKIWPEVINSVLFRKIMPNVVETLIDNQGMVIGDIPDLLHNAEYRKTKTRNLHNRHVRNFWQSEYKEKDAEVLDNRLRDFLIDPVIEHITCHPNGSIDLRSAIEEKQIILVKLPTELKQYERSAPIIGTILLSLITSTIFSFEDTEWNKRPGVSLFVDEVENFITDDFDTIYNQARKYKARLSIANQHLYQLPQTMKKAATAADSVITFKVDKDDARDMAPILFDKTLTQRPTSLYYDVLNHLNKHPHQSIRTFYQAYVSRWQDEYKYYKRQVEKYRTYGDLKDDDFVHYRQLDRHIKALEALLLDAEERQQIDEKLLKAYLTKAAPFFGYDAIDEVRRLYWKLFNDQDEAEIKNFLFLHMPPEIAEAYYLTCFVHFYYPDHDTTRFIPSEKVREDSAFRKYVRDNAQTFSGEQVMEAALFIRILVKTIVEHRLNLMITFAWEYVEDVKQKIAAERTQMWERIAALHDSEASIPGLLPVLRQFHAEQAYLIRNRTTSTLSPIIITYLTLSQETYAAIIRNHFERKVQDAKERERQIQSFLKEHSCYSLQILTNRLLSRLNRSDFLQRTMSIQELSKKAEEREKFETVHFDEWENCIHASDYPYTFTDYLPNALTKFLNNPTGETANSFLTYYSISSGNKKNEKKEIWEQLIKEGTVIQRIKDEWGTLEKFFAVRSAELDHIKSTLTEQERDLASQYEKAELEYEKLSKRRARTEQVIRDVCTILIAEPLGEARPYKESDVAYTLNKLPARHIMVKIAGETQSDPPRMLHLKTLDAPQAVVHKEKLAERIQCIREQTRKKYCRPVEEVEAHLRGDYQESDRAPVPPANKRQTRKLDVSELPDNLPEEERPARRKRIESEGETR